MFALHSHAMFKTQYAFNDINVGSWGWGVGWIWAINNAKSLGTVDDVWSLWQCKIGCYKKLVEWSRSHNSQRTTSQAALKPRGACLDQDYSSAYHTDSIVWQVSGVTYGRRFLQKHPKKLLPGLCDQLGIIQADVIPLWSIWILHVLYW